jgi:DNA-binding HxlR family transcriptional regulator
MRKTKDYGCPVEATLDVIGGKWKAVILSHLMREKKLRFGELRRLIPKATQQMLTLQLRELEKSGVIHREVYPQVPPKVEYSLTKFGDSLGPIVEQMKTWGIRYMKA